jgi:hypothetical protein
MIYGARSVVRDPRFTLKTRSTKLAVCGTRPAWGMCNLKTVCNGCVIFRNTLILHTKPILIRYLTYV